MLLVEFTILLARQWQSPGMQEFCWLTMSVSAEGSSSIRLSKQAASNISEFHANETELCLLATLSNVDDMYLNVFAGLRRLSTQANTNTNTNRPRDNLKQTCKQSISFLQRQIPCPHI
ncbi:hypothetical protein V6N12_073272 [Hibiscus sabdariffa]|uniref:Uncharacterized protein n=1 Tax=Hibiscus sabdariffa TaxID=183260 RepID=A0ABR2B753_9ROSI